MSSFLQFQQVTGQKIKTGSYSKEISFTCDNDFFLFSGSDRYYTNGLFFDYTYISKTEKLAKIISKFTLGQKIFTAFKRKIPPENVQLLDRPITGYLYFNYSVLKFFENNQLLSLGITPGIIGPAAFGEEVQTSWHRLIGIKSQWDWIWKYQLHNAFGVDLEAAYAKTIIGSSINKFQISPLSNISVGTNETFIKQDLVFQVGKFNNMHNSELWGSLISRSGNSLSGDQKANRNVELFFYYQPSIMYQFYNATIEGGMFTNNKGPIVDKINNWVLMNTCGISTSVKNVGALFQIVYQSREATSQFDSHIYGTIKLSYKF